MKNYRRLFIGAFFIIYCAGVISGCLFQTGQENQQEIYTYLENAVSAYDAKMGESIATILRDNLGLFVLCAAGVVFKLFLPAIAVAVFFRGFSAGFAIIAALRLYGFGGIFLSAANIFSLMLLIPAISACGCGAIGNITDNRYNRKDFLKRAFFLVTFLAVAFLADGLIRGGLSAVLTDFTAKILSKN